MTIIDDLEASIKLLDQRMKALRIILALDINRITLSVSTGINKRRDLTDEETRDLIHTIVGDDLEAIGNWKPGRES